MKKVLLIHQKCIQHYRVPVYNYLSSYLMRNGYELTVASEGFQSGNTTNHTFLLKQASLNLLSIAKMLIILKPDAVIMFVNLKNHYLFPLIFILKIAGIKAVYWGHGIDLQDKKSKIKLFLNWFQHQISDAIILYAEHLKVNIDPKLHKKCFVANNTLNFNDIHIPEFKKEELLLSYGISTKKNIICTGRIQKRKRIDDLISAFQMINNNKIGLIIVGPIDKDMDYLYKTNNPNIVFTGPVYGEKVLQLLKACDVYCIPGAIGLSIVDAQFCGLPVVTEDVDHGPEIMYLKNGQNGYIVPKGNITALAEKIQKLFVDDILRKRFSENAYNENRINGHINRLCEGFKLCLDHFFLKNY